MFEIILVTKVVLFSVADAELAVFEMAMSIININIFKTCISIVLSIILCGVVAIPIFLPVAGQEVGAGGLVPGTIVHCYVGILPSIADYPTPISDRVVCGDIPAFRPVVAEWFVADAYCHVVKTVLVVAVLTSVTSVTCVLLVFIVKVPAFSGLKASRTHYLVTMIFICLADLYLPGFISCAMVLLSEPASHGVWLGGGLCARGEGGGGVVVVAEAGVAGAHIAVDAVWWVRLYSEWWTMVVFVIEAVKTFNTHIRLVEKTTLFP